MEEAGGLVAQVVAQEGGADVVALVGEIDYDSAQVFSDCLLDRLADAADGEGGPRPCRVVLDLSAMGFMDSYGLSRVLTHERLLRASGGWLRLAAPHGQTRRLLETTGMEDVLPVYPDVPSALAGADRPGSAESL
ncbi:STAS domain-containing protein [Streptomyces sp. NPDC059637]|uniref:STAS domain-containing protein n=1 Tax=Streptomyces sp. NPDC059637 TaxID=3347752 RepID=UPI00367F0E6C